MFDSTVPAQPDMVLLICKSPELLMHGEYSGAERGHRSPHTQEWNLRGSLLAGFQQKGFTSGDSLVVGKSSGRCERTGLHLASSQEKERFGTKKSRLEPQRWLQNCPVEARSRWDSSGCGARSPNHLTPGKQLRYPVSCVSHALCKVGCTSPHSSWNTVTMTNQPLPKDPTPPHPSRIPPVATSLQDLSCELAVCGRPGSRLTVCSPEVSCLHF